MWLGLEKLPGTETTHTHNGSADTYADLIEAMKTIRGEQAIVSLLPEFAAVLAKAGRNEQSSEQIRLYLVLQAATAEPLSVLDMSWLQRSIDRLMSSGKVDPTLLCHRQSHQSVHPPRPCGRPSRSLPEGG